MHIKIRNYRGIESADIELSPIALVAGINGAGKTSVAQAVAAALTSNAAIVEGVTKAAAGQLLRDGAKRGQCAITTDGGSAAANWPGASVSADGERPPHASAIACGLDCIAEMKPKEAAAALQAALRADPSTEQLTAALVKAGARPELAAAVAGKTEAEGYDAAWKRAQSRGTELKGQWELITGERWGAAKAEGWRASAAHADAGMDELKDAATAAGQALEQAIADQSADAAQVARLRDQVKAGEEAQRNIEALLAKRDEARDQAEAAVANYGSLPRPGAPEETVPCPHCGGHVVIIGKKISEPVGAESVKERDDRIAALTSANAEIARTRSVAEDAARHYEDARRAVEAGARAKTELDEVKAGGTSAEDIAAARRAAEEAHAALRGAEVTAAATEKHRAIVEMLAVAEVLAPTGIRQAVLEEAMRALHVDMAVLSKRSGWAELAIGDDLGITYGGRPYRLLSASEQFRARVLLQVALAMSDGSSAVIIDAADILDRTGRNGLFGLLAGLSLPTLITMTMNRADDVPVLGRLGNSYWIDGATLHAHGADAPEPANDNRKASATENEADTSPP